MVRLCKGEGCEGKESARGDWRVDRHPLLIHLSSDTLSVPRPPLLPYPPLPFSHHSLSLLPLLISLSSHTFSVPCPPLLPFPSLLFSPLSLSLTPYKLPYPHPLLLPFLSHPFHPHSPCIPFPLLPSFTYSLTHSPFLPFPSYPYFSLSPPPLQVSPPAD